MSYRISIISRDSQVPLEFENVRAIAANYNELEFSQIDQVSCLVMKRIGGLEATLFWDDQNGELYTTHPETDIVAGMIDLADQIGGRVRGQNFESYKTPFETFEHPDDQLLIERAREEFKRSRKIQAWKNFGKKMTLPLGIVVLVLALNGPWLWPKPPVFTKDARSEIEAVLSNDSIGSRADAIFVPLDDFDFRFVAELARQSNAATGLVVRTVPPIRTVPIQPYPDRERQYDALRMVGSLDYEIGRLRRDYGGAMIVFFTTKDINQGESPTRFVFAHHDYLNRISMLSAHRLVQGHGMAFANREIIQARLLKFSLRAIGEQHFALPRSTDRKSVMFSPINNLIDVDRMGFEIELPE